MKEIIYSIVVPVFNSESTIIELFDRIRKVFEDINESFEIIFIEDGGKDSSWKIISELKLQHPEIITAIRFAKNYGQHNATICGFTFAKGQYIITIDDDLQVPPEEILKLIDTYQSSESELVYGYFKKKNHSFVKNMGSKLLKQSGKFFNDSPGEGSSFRLLKKELVKKIIEHSQSFVFIDEILLWYTDDISFVKVDHQKRISNKSGYTNYKLFQLTVNLIIYYSALPLKLMTWSGFVFSVLTFFIGIYFLIRKFVFHNVEHGYTSIIVAILFSTSIIIFSLGIIGEYLNRMYMMQNKKPPYSIKKIL